MEPNQKQPDELKSDAAGQATQESAAAESAAQDTAMEVQDSEEGSTEG